MSPLKHWRSWGRRGTAYVNATAPWVVRWFLPELKERRRNKRSMDYVAGKILSIVSFYAAQRKAKTHLLRVLLFPRKL